MGVVIDFQTRRLGVDLGPVQAGMDTVSNFLEMDLPAVSDAHQGYGVVENEERQVLAAGHTGLKDFRLGLDGVLGDETEETASFAYGAYYAGRILLPELVMQTPAAARRFSRIVDEGIKQKPEADFPVMAEHVAARTAASICLMALWSRVRDSGHDVRMAFSKRVNASEFPPGNRHVASAFKHRLDERDVFRLLDKPVPRKK